MVGPGQVDDDLQEEVKDECSAKYGAVAKCLVYEVTSRGVAPEQAVRIFVEFQDDRSAQNGKAKEPRVLPPCCSHMDVVCTLCDTAVTGLNGRFFGGRRVQATFYDHDRFHRMDLMA